MSTTLIRAILAKSRIFVPEIETSARESRKCVTTSILPCFLPEIDDRPCPEVQETLSEVVDKILLAL